MPGGAPRPGADSRPGPLDPRWYAKLYDRLGRRYDDLPLAQGAEAEAAFLVEALALAPGERVLDVGCGTARHAVELAARGLRVTGVDASYRLLDVGLEAARSRGVVVNLMHLDARELPLQDWFDAALSLREGAFGLLEDDAEDRKVLEKMRLALKAGGRLALNGLNRAYLEARPAEFPGFDPTTGYTEHEEAMTLESGDTEVVRYRDRAFGEEELAALVAAAGFEVTAVHGASAGDFGRRRPSAADRELLVLAKTL